MVSVDLSARDAGPEFIGVAALARGWKLTRHAGAVPATEGPGCVAVT
jgi:hypothetical protein